GDAEVLHLRCSLAGRRDAVELADSLRVDRHGDAGRISLGAADQRAVRQHDETVRQTDTAGEAGDAADALRLRIVLEQVRRPAGGAAVDAPLVLGETDDAAFVGGNGPIQRDRLA